MKSSRVVQLSRFDRLFGAPYLLLAMSACVIVLLIWLLELEHRVPPPYAQIAEALPGAMVLGLSMLLLSGVWLLREHISRRRWVEKDRDRLFDFSLDILCVLEADSTFRRCNPAVEQILGYAPESLIGRPLLDIVTPDDFRFTCDQLERLEQGKPVIFENRCLTASGALRWLAWRINPVAEEGQLYAVARDITDRKAAEDALKSESAFRKAMEESVVTGLRAIDLEGRIIYVNPSFCELVGFPAEALIGLRPPFPYWPPDQIDTAQEKFDLTLQGQAPSEGLELTICRPSGERREVCLDISPLIDSHGQQTGWMASMNDVTDAKRGKEALEAAQERFAAVLNGLEAAVFVTDATSDEVLFANLAFLRLYGEQVLGQSAAELAVPRPDVSRYLVDLNTLTHHPLPCELFSGDLHHSNQRWYHLAERATRWVDGRVVRMAIATDITERKQVETLQREQEFRLTQTSRLIAMGEMASSLAHELNQPLAAISNYCMGCASRLQSGQYQVNDLLTALQKASTQAERAGKIIRNIRGFVKKSEPRRAAVNLSEVLEEACVFAEADARKHRVKVCPSVAKDFPTVFADRIMIEQVLLNLIKNGIEAIALQATTEPQLRQVDIQASLQKSYAEVAVRDYGPGIAADRIDKLFTAFYTTKPEGMGMGLNICRSIIEFHHGHLWVETPADGGCCFKFTLPLENQGGQ